MGLGMLHGRTLTWLSMDRSIGMTLEERYKDDPNALQFYREKLIVPGWAGELDSVELAYIKAELRNSRSLRRRWGFRPSARRLSSRHVWDVAMSGLPKQKRQFQLQLRNGTEPIMNDWSQKCCDPSEMNTKTRP